MELFDYQKRIINSTKPIVIAIMARRTGKSTIIREKAKNSKSAIIVAPFEGSKAVYRDLPNSVTVATPEHFNPVGAQAECLIFDEADYISRDRIKEALERIKWFKQVYFLGSLSSLCIQPVIKENRFVFEIQSNLLWLTYLYGCDRRFQEDSVDEFVVPILSNPFFDRNFIENCSEAFSKDAFKREFLLNLKGE